MFTRGFWIVLAIALSALAVAFVSLRMGTRAIEANDRLIAASVWPFVQVNNENLSEGGAQHIRLSLTNEGAGPAKIHTFELFYRGKAMHSSAEFLAECCNYHGPSNRTAKDLDTPGVVTTRSASEFVLRPGDARIILDVRLTTDNEAEWKALAKARAVVSYQACYCSVLGQCWSSALRSLSARPVAVCPRVKVAYRR
jgi:hypothetical protein